MLRELPASLTPRANVALTRLGALTALPDTWRRIPGSLSLRYCTRLSDIPAALTVDETLAISQCEGLRELPERLTVGGAIEVMGCTELSGFAAGTCVGGNVTVSQSKSFQHPPPDLICAGFIYINHVSVHRQPRGEGVSPLIRLGRCAHRSLRQSDRLSPAIGHDAKS